MIQYDTIFAAVPTQSRYKYSYLASQVKAESMATMLENVMFQLELKTLGWLVTCGDNKPRNWMIFEWAVSPCFVVRLPSKRVLNATLAMDGVLPSDCDLHLMMSVVLHFVVPLRALPGVETTGQKCVSFTILVAEQMRLVGSALENNRALVRVTNDNQHINLCFRIY